MNAYIYQLAYTSPEVISLATAKKQLKVEDLGTFDDTLITEAIEAAIDEAENYIEANIRERKFRVDSDVWFDNNFEIPQQKVSSVTSIKYVDTAGAQQTLNSALYELLPIDKYASVINILDHNALPKLKEEINDAVKIEVMVGYATGKVPNAIKQAIKLLITDNYNFRGDREKKATNTSSRVKLEPYKYYKKTI